MKLVPGEVDFLHFLLRYFNAFHLCLGIEFRLNSYTSSRCCTAD